MAAGEAVPMIVVMDCGYANKAGTAPLAIGPGVSRETIRIAFRTFEDVIVHELIPMIDAAYRTMPDRDHRAMAGLSMGGMQTLFVTLHHLVRRDATNVQAAIGAEALVARCAFSAGESPAPVSVGAPGSRPQV